jgi:hypothetical protein
MARRSRQPLAIGSSLSGSGSSKPNRAETKDDSRNSTNDAVEITGDVQGLNASRRRRDDSSSIRSRGDVEESGVVVPLATLVPQCLCQGQSVRSPFALMLSCNHSQVAILHTPTRRCSKFFSAGYVVCEWDRYEQASRQTLDDFCSLTLWVQMSTSHPLSRLEERRILCTLT